MNLLKSCRTCGFSLNKYSETSAPQSISYELLFKKREIEVMEKT
jgi:hypothetical protein